jgi:hypothetical protein
MELDLYRVFILTDANVATFLPGSASARYKCAAIIFIPGGLEEAPTRPCEGAFALGGSSNRYKCPHLYWGQKYPVQMKNRDRDKYPIL